jgi:hypothetical protein
LARSSSSVSFALGGMSTIARFPLQFALITVLLSCGCDFRPKPTYQSPRRILALDVRPPTPPPVIVKYLLDTNDARVMQGELGDFRGGVTATTLSSNSTGWRLQLRFEGKMTSGSPLDTTNVLDIPYPQSRQVALPGIGTVTGWFLSDGELLAFDKRMTQ